ncbi:MAG: hypothetical protein Q8N03_04825 [Ignavibacteria bacterium]|nr:hypothetical protein [Ignavibacteria bacterium]MDP3830142.1 hypothetical protein [Ignavibacteriaceae bacterium]
MISILKYEKGRIVEEWVYENLLKRIKGFITSSTICSSRLSNESFRLYHNRQLLKMLLSFFEAIKSGLPLCDEFIVNVGISDDKTLEAVQNIKAIR